MVGNEWGLVRVWSPWGMHIQREFAPSWRLFSMDSTRHCIPPEKTGQSPEKESFTVQVWGKGKGERKMGKGAWTPPFLLSGTKTLIYRRKGKIPFPLDCWQNLGKNKNRTKQNTSLSRGRGRNTETKTKNVLPINILEKKCLRSSSGGRNVKQDRNA